MWFESITDLFLALLFLVPAVLYLLPDLRKGERISRKFMLSYIPVLVLAGLISAEGISRTPVVLITALAILNFVHVYFREKLSRSSFLSVVILASSLLVFYVSLSIPLGLEASIISLLMASLALIPFILLFEYLEISNFYLAVSALFAQFLDASSTVVALNHSLEESRLLAGFFIRLMGPPGIFLMKALTMTLVVYFLSQEFGSRYSRPLLFAVAAYGLVLAVRNIALVGA